MWSKKDGGTKRVKRERDGMENIKCVVVGDGAVGLFDRLWATTMLLVIQDCVFVNFQSRERL